jgi:uncharacterized damage-inducible protein DinB
MTGDEAETPKDILQRYLRVARTSLLSKLDGLSERDIRRPMVPTGTNLLGLVKHTASMEIGYFGEVFGRPSDTATPWLDDGAEVNADMWASADETRDQIVALHHTAAAHAEATINALDLDSPGVVPWWRPDSQNVTLQRILVHMIAETARHAGHADIVRELIDGQAGMRANDPNVPDQTTDEWSAYRARLEQAAEEAAARVAP